MKQIELQNKQKQMQMALDAEKNKFKKPGIETSKLIALYLFALLNAIIFFAMIAMWKFADLEYLGVLISDIAAQVLIYAIYCLKAYHAKKQSEQVKLDREKMERNLDDILDAGAECDASVPLTKGDIDDA